MEASSLLRISIQIVLLLLALAAPTALLAQSGRVGSGTQTSQNSSSEEVEDVVRVRTDEVVLPVSVRDERGLPVNGLTEDQFLIYENGVRQEIRSFNRRRVPANIVLMLDASGSVYDHMNLIRDAAKGFLKNLVEGDRVCVMQFADRVELLQDWVAASDWKRIERALEWRYHAGDRTSFYEGLYRTAREQLARAQGRRILILLTDGVDTAEGRGASYRDALDAVVGSEAAVYVVSLTKSLREGLDRRVGGRFRAILSGVSPGDLARYRRMIDEAEDRLIEIAEKTGGRIFFPHEFEDLLPAYEAIAEELRSQYILTYVPKKSLGAGEWRSIRVLVLPGGYDVATRSGVRMSR